MIDDILDLTASTSLRPERADTGHEEMARPSTSVGIQGNSPSFCPWSHRCYCVRELLGLCRCRPETRIPRRGRRCAIVAGSLLQRSTQETTGHELRTAIARLREVTHRTPITKNRRVHVGHLHELLSREQLAQLIESLKHLADGITQENSAQIRVQAMVDGGG